MYMITVNMSCNNNLKSRCNTVCQFLADLVSKLRSYFFIRRKTLNIVLYMLPINFFDAKRENIYIYYNPNYNNNYNNNI